MFRSGNGRFSYKQLDSFSKLFKSVGKGKHGKPESDVNKKVIIPPRIERGPTDILEALSDTVGMKSTAFHYKYPDDPYFYPLSKFNEKIYALALESGRKSARWVFKENPKFFMKPLSEPPIEEFIPKQAKEDPESEPTEETLMLAIEERNVSNAIETYKALLERNVEVSNTTKQCLLELVCFFNSEEKPQVDVEEKWYFGSLNKVQNEWRNSSFATELFDSMDPSCSLATSTMIQALFKYNNIDAALDLFESARVKKIRLSVGVYNAFLSKLNALHGNRGDKVLSSIENTLKEMSEQSIKPNLGTLNSTLSAISESSLREKFIRAEELMNEFVKLGIEPSLGTFGCMFRCLKGPSFIPFAESLLASIEFKHHQVLHLTDLKFFCHAMAAIDRELRASDLAIRLMEMFERNNNSKFIVTHEDKNLFHRHFSMALFNNSPLDTAMKIHKSYALKRYHPELVTYRLILGIINRTKAHQYLPELWEEMKFSRMNLQRTILKQIMETVENMTDEKALKVCHEAALAYLNDKNRLNEINSETYSNIVMSLLKNCDYEKFKSFWDEAKEYQDILFWTQNSVTEMYNYATQNDKTFLLDVLKIAQDVKHSNLKEMATNALSLVDKNSKNWVEEFLNSIEATKNDEKKISKVEKVSDNNLK